MRLLLGRAGWGVAGVLAIALVLMAARAAHGGPIDPPAPIGSTLQPLDELPPDWVQFLDSANGDGNGCGSSRFDCVMPHQWCVNSICFTAYEGVLDHETGLVWQRNLSNYALQSWESAEQGCGNFTGGERKGWRLPTAAELMSLLDPTVVSPSPSLPAGHPFQNVPSQGVFWTSTRDFAGATFWVVRLSGFNPGVPGDAIPAGIGTANGAWCVRAAD
jgi:hypothetical protein